TVTPIGDISELNDDELFQDCDSEDSREQEIVSEEILLPVQQETESNEEIESKAEPNISLETVSMLNLHTTQNLSRAPDQQHITLNDCSNNESTPAAVKEEFNDEEESTLNDCSNNESTPVAVKEEFNDEEESTLNDCSNNESTPVAVKEEFNDEEGSTLNDCSNNESTPVAVKEEFNDEEESTLNDCSNNESTPVAVKEEFNDEEESTLNDCSNNESTPVAVKEEFNDEEGSTLNDCSNNESTPVAVKEEFNVEEESTLNDCSSNESIPAASGKYGEGFIGSSRGIAVHVRAKDADGAHDHTGCMWPLWSVATNETLPKEPWVAVIRRGNCNFEIKTEKPEGNPAIQELQL
ncbi:putative goliath E3 ubiquitin ligase, partial [Operophtera brumata]